MLDILNTTAETLSMIILIIAMIIFIFGKNRISLKFQFVTLTGALLGVYGFADDSPVTAIILLLTALIALHIIYKTTRYQRQMIKRQDVALADIAAAAEIKLKELKNEQIINKDVNTP